MKLVLGIATTYLAAVLAAPSAFGQTAPRVHSASNSSGASGVATAETPYLGVGAVDITADRSRALKLKEEIGVEVTKVEDDSAAAKAGLKVGDVILEYNGQKVQGWEQLTRLVRETPIHRDVKLVVWRNGAEQTLTATMGSHNATSFSMSAPDFQAPDFQTWMQPMPPTAPMPPIEIPQFRTLLGTASLGITGEGLGQDSQLAGYFGVKDGVLVRQVNQDSAAEKAGMKAGDVITKIEDTAISTPQQISSALRAARNKTTVTVTVVRKGKEMTLTVTPDANTFYRGGIWIPRGDDNNLLLEFFGQPRKIDWRQ